MQQIFILVCHIVKRSRGEIKLNVEVNTFLPICFRSVSDVHGDVLVDFRSSYVQKAEEKVKGQLLVYCTTHTLGFLRVGLRSIAFST